jgi:hypothetical protein
MTATTNRKPDRDLLLGLIGALTVSMVVRCRVMITTEAVTTGGASSVRPMNHPRRERKSRKPRRPPQPNGVRNWGINLWKD